MLSQKGRLVVGIMQPSAANFPPEVEFYRRNRLCCQTDPGQLDDCVIQCDYAQSEIKGTIIYRTHVQQYLACECAAATSDASRLPLGADVVINHLRGTGNACYRHIFVTYYLSHVSTLFFQRAASITAN